MENTPKLNPEHKPKRKLSWITIKREIKKYTNRLNELTQPHFVRLREKVKKSGHRRNNITGVFTSTERRARKKTKTNRKI